MKIFETFQGICICIYICAILYFIQSTDTHLEYRMVTRRMGITKYTVVAASIMYKVPKFKTFMLRENNFQLWFNNFLPWRDSLMPRRVIVRKDFFKKNHFLQRFQFSQAHSYLLTQILWMECCTMRTEEAQHGCTLSSLPYNIKYLIYNLRTFVIQFTFFFQTSLFAVKNKQDEAFQAPTELKDLRQTLAWPRLL